MNVSYLFVIDSRPDANISCLNNDSQREIKKNRKSKKFIVNYFTMTLIASL